MQAQQENIRDGNFYFPRLESNVKRFLSDPVNSLFFSKNQSNLISLQQFGLIEDWDH